MRPPVAADVADLGALSPFGCALLRSKGTFDSTHRYCGEHGEAIFRVSLNLNADIIGGGIPPCENVIGIQPL
jgi:hypothetical protein